MTLPLIKLTGSPYEQGYTHGKTLAREIKNNIAVYLKRYQDELGVNVADAIRRAQQYAPAIAQQNRAYYADMQGIADGAAVPFEQIVLLNVRYEVIYYEVSQQSLGVRDGCTAYAIHPSKNANGHLIMGQNWDWIPGVQGAILHIVDEDKTNGGKHEIMAFTEAGIVGAKIGMNSAGLGLGVNGLFSEGEGWRELRRPFHVRCYEILRQTNIEDAINVITNEDRACAGNFLLAQTPDHVADIEAAPEQHNRIDWANGCTVHANHFVDPAAVGIAGTPIYERRPFSCARQERMEQLIGSKPLISEDDLKTFLRDRENAPDSICRLADDPTRSSSGQVVTVTGAIINLTTGEMQFSDGAPCEAGFDRYVL